MRTRWSENFAEPKIVPRGGGRNRRATVNPSDTPPFGEGVLAWVATKDRKSMNHLLSGTALAAALAIAAPAWAQTTAPMTPSSPVSAAAAPAKPATVPAAPVATSAPHKRMHARHHASRPAAGHAYRLHAYHHRARPGDIANQLNAQELGRTGSSSAPGMAASYGWGGGGYGQPSPTQGMPGAWQSSASPHPASEMSPPPYRQRY